MSKEHNVIVMTDSDLWVEVCCLECGENIEGKVHSDDDNSLTVEVEPHQCKEEKEA